MVSVFTSVTLCSLVDRCRRRKPPEFTAPRHLCHLRDNHKFRIILFPGSPYIRAIGPVHAVAGHDITLHCPYSGYPISAINWERRGQEVPVDLRRSRVDGGSLRISRVDPAVDSGSYMCSVRGNSGELFRREVQLTVNSEYVP